MNLLIGLIAVTLASLLYSMVAFDRSYDDKPITAYALANLAAIVSVSAWVFLVRQSKTQKDIFIINVLWDIGIMLMLAIFPLVLYNLKLDIKTIIGCSIAIIGLIIAKM